MRVFLFAFSCLLSCVSVAQMPADSIVLTEKDGYVVMPPEVICQPHVVHTLWSPDGAYLLVFRVDAAMSAQSLRQAIINGLPPKPMGSLVLWNARSKRSAEVWRGESPDFEDLRANWFKTGGIALVQLKQRYRPEGGGQDLYRHTLLRVNASSSRAETLFQSSEQTHEEVDLSFSPAGDVAVFATGIEADDQQPVDYSVQFVRAAGPISKPILLGPPFPMGLLCFWTENGKACIQAYSMNREERKMTVSYRLIDPATGELTSVEKQPVWAKHVPPLQPVIDLSSSQHTLASLDRTKKLEALWLHSRVVSKYRAAFIAADVERPELAPDLQNVVYTTAGVAIVRPLVKLSRAELEVALAAAERATLMSNARQVGLALHMYAADNNDIFPGKGSDVRSLAEQYTKNGSLFDGFVYTFAGGSVLSIERPTETVLGYIEGPGGRAEVYADGHVKWVKS
jgi:hypothetical protein